MVFFTCNSCGQSVKKNKVDAHFSQCRSCQSLSCIDCGKDFWGQDYKTHNKCVSEQQKYGGKVTVNKGEVKQEKWVDQVKAAAAQANVPPQISRILQHILSFDNIPRKPAKFKNFLRTSANVRDDRLAEQVWKVLESSIKKDVPQNNAKQQKENQETDEKKLNDNENGTKEEEAESKDKKLSKRERKEERRMKNTKVEKKDLREPDINEEANEDDPGHKKKKNKKNRNEDENDDENIEEERNSKKKKKKKNKDKVENGEEMDISVNDDKHEVNESVNGGEKDSNKKKKHRKNKNGVENGKEELDESVSVADESAISEKNTSKKKKRSADDSVVADEDNDENSGKEKTNGVHEGDEKSQKHKKRKHDDDDLVNESLTNEGSPYVKKFKFEIAVRELLKAAPDHQLPLKRLRKKVFAEYGAYAAQKGRQYGQEKMWARLDKKLSKNPMFKVHKDKVTLKM